MPHLHAEPGQHDITVSAFVVRTDGPEPRIVLHWHLKTKMLLQFGGHVELDETPWQGLARELREESGYSLSQLLVLQPPGRYSGEFEGAQEHPLPFYFNTHRFAPLPGHSHSDIGYVVLASEPPQDQPDEGESTDIRYLDSAGVRALPASEIHPQTRSKAEFILEHLIHNWDAVPAKEWPV